MSYYNRATIRLSADFLTHIFQAKRHWQKMFHVMKSKGLQSRLLYPAMKSYLKEDVTFHAMQVSGRNTSHDLYLLQVNKTLPIIKETSFDLNNDRVFSPPIFKKNHDISFLIAREENVLMNHIVIVSDEFVSLCARHQLKINFRQTLTE